MRDKLVRFAEPILVMEMRKFRRRSLTAVVVLAAILLVSPVLFLFSRDQITGQVALVIMAAGYGIATLTVIPSYGARSMSRERETGAWDLLSLTLVKSIEMADQKIIAAALPILALIVAGLPMAIAAAMLALSVLAISAWSVESSCDCGRAAIWVAYLPAATYICIYVGSLLQSGVFLVAVVLLFDRKLRGQAGRMLLASMCLQVVLGAVGFQFMRLAFGDEPGMPISEIFQPGPVSDLIAFAAVLLQVLALIGMRHIVAWSIESWRRT